MKKEFDNQAIEQLKSLYSIYHQDKLYKEEISDLITPDNEIFEALSSAPPWSQYYELPYEKFLAVYAVAINSSEIIKSAAESPNSTQVIINDIDNALATKEKTEILNNETMGLRTSLTIAAGMQQLSISIHAQPLSRLVERVRGGDDSALFDAVVVDRSIVSSPTIARRIQVAELTNDQSFMENLSKAITKTKPVRPKEKYDDLRFMIYLIDDLLGLDNIPDDKLHNLIVKELELYDDSPDDMSESLEKIIQRIRKKSRT
jgi:hypothetical protein